MSYIRGFNRNQLTLFTPRPGADLADDHPARRIDVFVDGLDLEAMGFSMKPRRLAGRPAYDPRDLLKLHLYGRLRHLRSCRDLQHEARHDPALAWLLGGLRPSFKTIARFKQRHGEALDAALRRFRAAHAGTRSKRRSPRSPIPQANGSGGGSNPPPEPSHARSTVHAQPERS